MKKQNKVFQNARFIDEKLKTSGLMFFFLFFLCDLQDVNRKAFGERFLYRADFNTDSSKENLYTMTLRVEAIQLKLQVAGKSN